VVFCLLFLVGTCEMQSIANSITVGSSNEENTSTPITSMLQERYDKLSAQFDKEGKIGKIVKDISKTVEDSILVADRPTPSVMTLAISDRLALCASIVLSFSLSTSLISFGPDNTFSKPKATIVDFLKLLSSALFFHSFLLVISYIESTNTGDGRLVYPLLARLLFAALFSLKPMVELMKFETQDPAEQDQERLQWTEFFALLAFHCGNMAEAAFFFTNEPQNGLTKVYQNRMRAFSLLLFTMGSAFLLSASDVVKSETKISENKQKIFTLLGTGFFVGASSIVFYHGVPQ